MSAESEFSPQKPRGENDAEFSGENSIHWHTGDPETDPWEWRMRVLDERDDIAYSKVFFKKAGYITKEWYPYFLAARLGDRTFEDEYSDGLVSVYAKRGYMRQPQKTANYRCMK